MSIHVSNRLNFAKFDAYLIHQLLAESAAYFDRPILPALNRASFGSHDSRSDVGDGVWPNLGSAIFTDSAKNKITQFITQRTWQSMPRFCSTLEFAAI